MTFEDYFACYGAKDAPFMHEQWLKWRELQPLKGLTGLHCVPLVPNTLLKIACLVAAGMEITAVNPECLRNDTPSCQRAVACLESSGVRYVADCYDLRQQRFDIYFDCGAELYQKLGRPAIGAVELTGSGDDFYRRQTLDFPVVSIDRTLTKQLETVFGTAVSAALAIEALTGYNPAEKSWLIFGFGKIGRGLACYCQKYAVSFTVVEPCPNACRAATALGIACISPLDKKAVAEAVSRSDIVITASGKKAIMDEYPVEWFENRILANMGIYDEFGARFCKERVLNHKAPLNFVLEDPTPIQYMDPEFYAHNLAALDLLEGDRRPGVYDLSLIQDNTIIRQWCQYHRVSDKDIQKWFIPREEFRA
ncbi:adenosylhomocysteinase [Legionella spiritensis]|uniref:adenosylhomocysteinase n=1 Tax=Legionella spiritensis TaxID=452 RepID=UPI000F716E19|nr:adenosylhomocysteinase [Legionella spiritensis]VEG92061.1 adenosylhomocysteinase [Legionella spiritensis]